MSLLALFLSIVVMACGNTADGKSTSPSNQTQQCGTITQSLNPRAPQNNSDQVQNTGNCFWHAYQQCQPATLSYIFTGIDTITTDIFKISQSHNTCTITGTMQLTIVPHVPSLAK